MGWSQLYRLRSFFTSSLWIVPFAAIPLELALTRVLHILDEWLGWTLLGLAREGAQALFQTIITSMLSFVVFTFGSLLVAVQIAGGQLTPRIIATTLLRDGTVKYVVGLFIFTLFFAVSALDRMGEVVHQLVAFVSACLGIAGFAAFLFLIDYAARLLRPVSILSRVGDVGISVIDSVYPGDAIETPPSGAESQLLGAPSRIINHEKPSGVVLAVNVHALVKAAEKVNGLIEFVPQVGDFVARDDPLFKLYDGTGSIDTEALTESVVFGSERTMEQDPTFAFRIVVDIALRALSPAINDPTTAVLAIDQLHRMLRRVGQRQLQTDRIVDHAGRLRVYFRTPNWENFTDLAFSEIRSCGSNNLQIVRRLRAMIENLLETLPESRHAALLQQRSLLDRAIEAHFKQPEERLLASIPDPQGLGGRSGHERGKL